MLNVIILRFKALVWVYTQKSKVVKICHEGRIIASFYLLKSFPFLMTNFTLKLILAKRSFLTESLQHVQYRPFSAPCQYSLAFLEALLSDHWARPQNSKLGLLILKCQQMRRFVTRSSTLKWTCKTWRAATSVIDSQKKDDGSPTRWNDVSSASV